MGFFDRLRAILGAKIEKSLDAIEDPKEMLDFSLSEMEKSLGEVSENLVQVTSSKKRLEMQLHSLQASVEKYDEQARQALSLDQEDLARVALSRKAQAGERLASVEQQIKDLQHHVDSMIQTREELRDRISSFRDRKEELKAVYDASKAQLAVKESMVSLGKDTHNIAGVIDRTESRIQQVQARVQALDELVAQGLANDVLGDGTDDVDRKLAALSRNARVEDELARLKEQVAAREAKPEAAQEEGH